MDPRLDILKKISSIILDPYTEYGIWSRIKYIPNNRLEPKIKEIMELLIEDGIEISHAELKECAELILTLCMSFPNYEAECPYIHELQKDLYLIEKWIIDTFTILYPNISLIIKK